MTFPTVTELAKWLRFDVVDDDTDALVSVVDQARADIEAWCGRTFPDVAGSATARTFAARWCDVLFVDDIGDTTGFVVETDAAGSGAWTTWTAADYQLEPSPRRAGLTDHPYYKIRAIKTQTFPVTAREAVRVTADWGWTTLPAAVHTAALIHAGKIHSRRKSAAGIALDAAFPTRTAMGLDKDVAQMLEPFRRLDMFV